MTLPDVPDTPTRNSDRGPRDVVFISRQRLVGATNGSSAYLLDLARAVRDAGFVPHLVQPSPDLLGRWPLLRIGPDMQVFATHSIRDVWRVGHWVLAKRPDVYRGASWAILSRIARRAGLRWKIFADRPRPYAIAQAWTARDHAFVRRHLPPGLRAAIADYAFQAETFTAAPPINVPTAIVMHDLFHRRQGNQQDSVALLDRETEIELLSRADAIIAIQADEATFVADAIAGMTTILAPMAARPVSEPQAGEACRLLFVGSNTAPNIVGLQWLFDNVWPGINREWPEARLDIVGAVSRGFDSTPPAGVRFLGVVDDLASFYTRAGVVLSPLTFGSGLKIKLIEALATGKAIVATSITLQGVEREVADAVMRADSAQDFAAAILSLRDDGTRFALAERALAAALRHFSAETVHADFRAWLCAAQGDAPQQQFGQQ